MYFSTGNFDGSLNSIPQAVFGYIGGLTSNAQQQINNVSSYAISVSGNLYDTNAIAISVLVEVKTFVATLGFLYVVNEAGQGVLSTVPQADNQSNILCQTLTAYTDVTSGNMMSSKSLNVTDTVTAQTVNCQYSDINVSLSTNRIYSASSIYSQGTVNASYVFN